MFIGQQGKCLLKYDIYSLSSHFHLLTNDGYLIYGTKINQFNQISGFGGFPNITNKNLFSIDEWKKEALKKELGKKITNNISKIETLGITKVNIPNLKGMDIDFLVYLDISKNDFEKDFIVNWQFNKKLIFVEFSEKGIEYFLGTYLSEDNLIFSPYAYGCMYYILSYYFNYDFKKYKQYNPDIYKVLN